MPGSLLASLGLLLESFFGLLVVRRILSLVVGVFSYSLSLLGGRIEERNVANISEVFCLL